MKNNFLKKTISFILGTVLTLSLLGCGESNSVVTTESSEADSSTAQTIETQEQDILNQATQIRIGYNAAAKDVFVTLEEQYHEIENHLQSIGVTAQFVEFSSPSAMLDALGAGEIDVTSFVGDSAIITARGNGYPVEAIAFGPEYKGTLDMICSADSGINTLADVAGKRIGVTIGSSTHFFTLRTLETVGLTADDVELINIDVYDGEAAMSHGDVDVIIGSQPASTVVAERLGAHILADVPVVNKGATYTAGNTDYSSANPAIVTNYVESLQAYLDYTEGHREEVAGFLTDKFEYDFTNTVNGWNFYYLPDEALWNQFQATIDFYNDNEAIASYFTADKFFNTTFAEQAATTHQKIGE